MTNARRTACVAVCFLVVAAAVCRAAGEPVGEGPDFHALLRQAAEAYDAGQTADARARLREAVRQITPDEFHGMLDEAAERYDAGEASSARAVLKRATRYINPWFWVIFGFVAQAMFVGRFAVQWIASERRGESVVPIAFWYLSLFGSWGLLSYAIWRQDIVIILGQAFNSIIYVRNLMFVYRKRRRDAAASAQEAAE